MRANDLVLRYNQPAQEWVEALPLGNGRIGAMVYGRVDVEEIQLNEGTLWAGGPHCYDSPDALEALPKIRQMMLDGQVEDAQRLVNECFMGRPNGQMPYQPVGSLRLDFGHGNAANYSRELNLRTATALCRYELEGVRYNRSAWVSASDQVLVIQLTADQPSAIGVALSFSSPQRSSVEAKGQQLILRGTSGSHNDLPGEVDFEAIADVTAIGGSVQCDAAEVRVVGADSVTIRVSIATSFVQFDDVSADPSAIALGHLEAAEQFSDAELHQRHLEDFQRLFGRVEFDLESPAEVCELLPDRLAAFHRGLDHGLAALYFQFGRYLLISCSRPGGQPATLQGLWNDSMNPPWQSKYTVNINTEMNYWPAQVANLAECEGPLVALVADLAMTGRKTARDQYGARGWVCHHNTDLWRGTAPVDWAEPGMWPTGGAWLALHLWERFRFQENLEELRANFELLRGAAEFFLDSLIEHPRYGWMVTCPSVSPENAHHEGQNLCAGPAMDTQIISALFDACLDAARRLGISGDFPKEVREMRDRLAPMQIGHLGQLQEWIEDWDSNAPEPHHRHVSHLWALYPGNQISPETTPELFEAARQSLELRGDAGTGWSLAWKINLWARLRDGDRAFALIQRALMPVDYVPGNFSGGGGVYPNLFDAHPPFQIDGNFGFTSGVVEMLLQSQGEAIEILPALPTAWPTGAIRGIRARGGITADLVWERGTLRTIALTAAREREISVRYRQSSARIKLNPGVPVTLGAEQFL